MIIQLIDNNIIKSDTINPEYDYIDTNDIAKLRTILKPTMIECIGYNVKILLYYIMEYNNEKEKIRIYITSIPTYYPNAAHIDIPLESFMQALLSCCNNMEQLDNYLCIKSYKEVLLSMCNYDYMYNKSYPNSPGYIYNILEDNIVGTFSVVEAKNEPQDIRINNVFVPSRFVNLETNVILYFYLGNTLYSTECEHLLRQNQSSLFLECIGHCSRIEKVNDKTKLEKYKKFDILPLQNKDDNYEDYNNEYVNEYITYHLKLIKEMNKKDESYMEDFNFLI